MPMGIDNGAGDTSGRWTCAVSAITLYSDTVPIRSATPGATAVDNDIRVS
jgi:hypothetical protein